LLEGQALRQAGEIEAQGTPALWCCIGDQQSKPGPLHGAGGACAGVGVIGDMVRGRGHCVDQIERGYCGDYQDDTPADA
jgi:hypothetical protein